MKFLSLIAALAFATPAWAPLVDGGSSDGGADAGVAPYVMTTFTLEDGGQAPVMLLPDGGMLVPVNAEDLDAGSVSKDIILAARTKNWKLLIAGFVILMTWGARLFGGRFFPVLKTDRGGVVTAMVITTVGSLFNAWKAGAGVTPQLFVDAFAMGFFAIGGFTAMKKVFFPADKPKPEAEFVPEPYGRGGEPK